ncbi:Isoleucyl-tRNA synthetase [Ochromonadaceae sp. CCMP2298]|nr:Isoleucyl-tRNA synthetase [Ochromonadaceae sp. CCMP2298]|mmetsp:Transcript_22207/g.49398  ORF Transcript_22207/g.49398 Transcript_22207/m.49398 type:complete len:1171 (-) Transcript_22207:51-3563(-)
MAFDTLTEKINFPEEEQKILQYWVEIDAFNTSLELSKDKPEYTFYDGPPFATGLPHYGHILAGTIKDTVTRYAHQTGHHVSRRFGWDCHGLPVEYEIDKKLGITGREMVLEMGVAKYNMECRSIVTRYTAEWEKTVTRMGRWIDFKNDYKTMDPNFMESVWWVFDTMFKKGLVYRGYKVMPYSTFCGTPLSNFEAGLNYKDVNDPAAVVSFPLLSDPEVSLLAWTTTPWTLPSNLALCVNPTFLYVKIRDKTREGKLWILLEGRLGQIFPEVNKADCTDEKRAELYEILETISGDKLVGLQYKPLFDYFKNQPGAFRVLGDSYVTVEGGTGIVHQAPAFGEDDYRVCMAHGVVSKSDDLPCPVDSNGRFTSEVPEYVGRAVKEADNDICTRLKAEGRLVLKEVYRHSYPFCWRSETPLIYKVVPSWFVSVEKIKSQLIANNAKTYWVPAFVQEKRFHNWLSDAKDWAISRNRFWGTPIPLWISDDLEEMVTVGSVEELYQLSGERVTDLHKESIDHITIPSKQGKGLLKRIDEVFDCWFESGSMPYAQQHYPFENKEKFEGGFPADFIAEGLDQTRGWFYTLMVISTCLFDKPAFKNLIVNGLVLAADGKKMSKRLQNYPDPTLVVDNCGADALRLYLINSPVVRADVLKFQEEGVNEVVRGVLLPWFNSFRFFDQCVKRWEGVQGGKFVPDPEVSRASTNDVDIWILAASLGLVEFVHQEMKAYRLYTVVPRLVDFIDQLTKWYVRLNRFRIKGESGQEEALQGLNVLYEVLAILAQIMAPFLPFFSEFLYQHIRKLHPNFGSTDPAVPRDSFGRADSVHYLMLPVPDPSRLNPRAVARFNTLQQAVTLARTARERRHIRNNLPLRSVTVVAAKEEDIEALQYLRSYFMEEINAWEVDLSTEWKKMCQLKVMPNWKALGKRLGKKMKDVAAAVNALTEAEVLAFIDKGEVTLCGFLLTKEDIAVRREFNGDAKRYEASASEDGSLMVAIDTAQDEELFSELRARSVVSAVQKLRKSSGLVLGDVVEYFYQVEEKPGKKGGAVAAEALLEASMTQHAATIAKRLKTGRPYPLARKAAGAVVVATDTLEDADLCAGSFRLFFTLPTACVDVEAVALLTGSADIAAQYLQTLDHAALMTQPSVSVSLEGVSVTFLRGVHYFASVAEQQGFTA